MPEYPGKERTITVTDDVYKKFVHDHVGEIVEKVIELDNFSESDIAVVKSQIVSGINRKKKQPVAPMSEIKQLMVGYIAIKFIEEELGFEF